MPSKGFTCLTLPWPLYQRLKQPAKQHGISIPRLTELLVTSKNVKTKKPKKRLKSEKNGGPDGI